MTLIVLEKREHTGEIVVRESNGKSILSDVYNRYPLKFLAPKIADHVLWLYMINYGGGLISGDVITAKMKCEKNATLAVTCQSSTKVYKSVDNKMTVQAFDINIEEGALFAMLPHPVTCFANARFQQRQSINCDNGGSVVCLDWLTCGRCARGECWAFNEYSSKVHLRVGGKLLINDCTKLSNEGGRSVADEMQNYHTFANIFLYGERVKHISNSILKEVQKQPVNDIKNNKTIMFSASPISDGRGVFVRLATANITIAFAFLRSTFKELFEELGNDPFKS